MNLRDIEIYIRDIEFPAVIEWLSCHLNEVSFRSSSLDGKPAKGRGAYQGDSVRVSVYPGAGGKRFASVIIEGNELPWGSDLECGRSAFQALDGEIRCSPGNWKEGEPVEDERWWRLDYRGEQLAIWN